jgi:D-amino-acid dehydrogenase
MRVVVLGAGVIGVTSAWYLSQAGHSVTVVDRQPGPALETSFANAGEISPGYASPWAAPGIPAKALRWLVMKHAPLILRPRPDMAMLRWLGGLLRNCNEASYALNKSRMVRLAEFSRDRLIDLREDTGIRYDERMQGTLQLFRTGKQMEGMAKDIAILKADGIPFEVLDRQGCIAAEPGLANSAADFAGGLRLPKDETGDCFKFTNALAAMAKDRDVTFVQATVRRLVVSGGKIVYVQTSDGLLEADAYVVALGSHSPLLLAPIGIKLPVYPVKGYSLTVPITDAARAPVSTLLDESYKVAITRLGDRIRIGGMAELSGYSNDLPRRGAPRSSIAPDRCSRRRRFQQGGVLVRAPADDPGQHARDRRHPDSEPVPEHRSRHAGMDDGLRFRTCHSRSHLGQPPRHRSRGSCHQPLCLMDGSKGETK